MRAPDDSTQWKCGWIDCFHGMGLAGSGHCPGEWWNKDCPNYELEEDALERWGKEHAEKNKDVQTGV